MAEHTPGPWIAEHVGRGRRNGWHVHGPDRPGEYAQIVQSASAQDWDYGPIDSEADARLIASAPDLLKRVMDYGHDVNCASLRPEETLTDECSCGYAALIAKATGTEITDG